MSEESIGSRTSLDVSDDDDFIEPWESLLNYLTTTHIEKINEMFQNPDKTGEKYIKLSKEKFIDGIDNVLGNKKYSLQALLLYNEVPYPEEEKITWHQFLDYFINKACTKDVIEYQLSSPELVPVPHIKRETIIKIVLLETETSFCYAVVSKYGKVALYDGGFQFLSSYNVIFSRSYKDINVNQRRKSIWITDATFLSNFKILIISSCARTLTFYDAAGQKHKPLWLIEGVPRIVQCLVYSHNMESKIFLGDETGSIIKLTFLKNSEELFPKKYSTKLNVFYWREVLELNNHVKVDVFQKIHSEKITSMIYNEETYTLISCSPDKKKSVVIFNEKEQKSSYVFKAPQGATCFSASYRLHILITGNKFGVLQVWDIYVTNNIVTNLLGHKTSIVDVQIFSYRKMAISCSLDGVVKLWNLKNYNCEQTLPLNYPCFKVMGKLIEWGISSVYPGPKHDCKYEENDQSQDVDSELEVKFSIYENFEEDPWIRPTILIACCNQIGKIRIIDNFENNYEELPMLPAPPLQNDVIIPPTWKIENLIIDIEEVPQSNEDMEKEIEYEEPIISFPELPIKLDYLENMGLDWDVNYKYYKTKQKLAKMKNVIKQGAPYIAMDLFELEEITLSPNLPIPCSKKSQQFAERTQRLLSAASTRSGILSDRSSKSRSSRSSIVEF